mmetsp:Transcript_71737/g.201280  ORF Transcript_71737/g.201280 Transcript_71737/m.201280 type:complete len:395 (+) Transcript_71737:529-1713(+)
MPTGAAPEVPQHLAHPPQANGSVVRSMTLSSRGVARDAQAQSQRTGGRPAHGARADVAMIPSVKASKAHKAHSRTATVAFVLALGLAQPPGARVVGRPAAAPVARRLRRSVLLRLAPGEAATQGVGGLGAPAPRLGVVHAGASRRPTVRAQAGAVVALGHHLVDGRYSYRNRSLDDMHQVLGGVVGLGLRADGRVRQGVHPHGKAEQAVLGFLCLAVGVLDPPVRRRPIRCQRDSPSLGLHVRGLVQGVEGLDASLARLARLPQTVAELNHGVLGLGGLCLDALPASTLHASDGVHLVPLQLRCQPRLLRGAHRGLHESDGLLDAAVDRKGGAQPAQRARQCHLGLRRGLVAEGFQPRLDRGQPLFGRSRLLHQGDTTAANAALLLGAQRLHHE